MIKAWRFPRAGDERTAIVAVVLCGLLVTSGLAADTAPYSAVNRPAWVDQKEGLRSGLYQMKVLIGPEPPRDACERKVDDAARAAIYKYLATNYPGVPLAVYDLRDDQLPPRVIGEKWEERVAGDGPANIFLHVQIRIEQRLQSQWLAAAQSYLARGRSANLIRWFLTAMWSVAVAHIALRLTPGGAVSGRRLVWAIAAILIVMPFLA